MGRVFRGRSYRNVLLIFGKKKVSKENLFGAYFRSRGLTRERSEWRTLFFCLLFFCLLFFSREKKSKGGSPYLYPGLSCVPAAGEPVADTAGRGLRDRRCGPVHEDVRNSQDVSLRFPHGDVNIFIVGSPDCGNRGGECRWRSFGKFTEPLV